MRIRSPTETELQKRKQSMRRACIITPACAPGVSDARMVRSAISNKERETRIEKAQELMRQQVIAALYLDAPTSLCYYTGLRAEGKESRGPHPHGER